MKENIGTGLCLSMTAIISGIPAATSSGGMRTRASVFGADQQKHSLGLKPVEFDLFDALDHMLDLITANTKNQPRYSGRILY